VNETSIGRHRMRRDLVEKLTADSALKIAESEALGPADWLKRYRATGGRIHNWSLVQRPEFEAVLNLTVDSDVDVQEYIKQRGKKAKTR
jgi:hypothetical protein